MFAHKSQKLLKAIGPLDKGRVSARFKPFGRSLHPNRQRRLFSKSHLTRGIGRRRTIFAQKIRRVCQHMMIAHLPDLRWQLTKISLYHFGLYIIAKGIAAGTVSIDRLKLDTS